MRAITINETLPLAGIRVNWDAGQPLIVLGDGKNVQYMRVQTQMTGEGRIMEARVENTRIVSLPDRQGAGPQVLVHWSVESDGRRIFFAGGRQLLRTFNRDDNRTWCSEVFFVLKSGETITAARSNGSLMTVSYENGILSISDDEGTRRAPVTHLKTPVQALVDGVTEQLGCVFEKQRKAA